MDNNGTENALGNVAQLLSTKNIISQKAALMSGKLFSAPQNRRSSLVSSSFLKYSQRSQNSQHSTMSKQSKSQSEMSHRESILGGNSLRGLRGTDASLRGGRGGEGRSGIDGSLRGGRAGAVEGKIDGMDSSLRSGMDGTTLRPMALVPIEGATVVTTDTSTTVTATATEEMVVTGGVTAGGVATTGCVPSGDITPMATPGNVGEGVDIVGADVGMVIAENVLSPNGTMASKRSARKAVLSSRKSADRLQVVLGTSQILLVDDAVSILKMTKKAIQNECTNTRYVHRSCT